MEAMICSFECTFCKSCVEQVLHNVCPNCGGGFEKRPVRPKKYADKYPAMSEKYIKPVDVKLFEAILNEYKDIEIQNR
jgi:hypothetical protein